MRNVKRLENEDNSHEGHEISEAFVDESAEDPISIHSTQDLAGSSTKSHMVKEVVYQEWLLNKQLPPEHKNNVRSAFIQWVDVMMKQHKR
jgi:hypothetical protein